MGKPKVERGERERIYVGITTGVTAHMGLLVNLNIDVGSAISSDMECINVARQTDMTEWKEMNILEQENMNTIPGIIRRVTVSTVGEVSRNPRSENQTDEVANSVNNLII